MKLNERRKSLDYDVMRFWAVLVGVHVDAPSYFPISIFEKRNNDGLGANLKSRPQSV